MSLLEGPKARAQTNSYDRPGPMALVKDAGSENLQSLVQAARAGEAAARERLIEKYQPFILKIAATVSRRYLQPGRDDEISVALMGFNEAIDCYQLGGKVPFLSFAEIVIRRRLVDYFRSQAVHNRELPLSSFEVEGEEEREGPWLPALAREAEAAQARVEESVERREEIMQLRTLLAEYGLSFTELARSTPKHADTRDRMIEIGRAVASDSQLRAQIKKRKALPIMAVALLSGLSRKTVERHRRYLLALVLILTNDLPHLQTYLRP